MKTVVIPNDISIPGVVNDEIYQKYTVLLERDIDRLLKSSESLQEAHCPGCSGGKTDPLARVMGMDYKVCAQCGSYFITPRPKQEILNRFYKDSTACRYWRQEMARLSDQQLYYIYGPRVAWMMEWADEHLGAGPFLVDYQTKYSFLIKHIHAQKVFGQIKLLEDQLFEKKGLLPDNFYVQDHEACPLLGQAEMFTAFESLERASDPGELIRAAYAYCQTGGLFLLTTASSSGFEYQVLKEHAPNLNPINRLNLLSLEAIVSLLEKNGFQVLELSTPGRLDVEIVKNVLVKPGAPDIDPFWKYVFGRRQARTLSSLQEFLQENRLSSHVRIVAKK